MNSAATQSLTAPHSLEYTYKRSLGPLLSQFFTALRAGKILGVRRADGTVMVPPKEYDPISGAGLSELVEVADAGVVISWAWVNSPRAQQPLQRPFAYALIKLDGADTPLLHVVDAGAAANMQSGMRVRARWAEQRTGAIGDFVFVPTEPKA